MSDGSPIPAVVEGAETPSAPEGAPQFSAHDLAMIEKGRAGLSDPTPPADPNAPVRPDHVPEKFWKDGKVDTEAMAKSYAELEKRLSAPKEEAPAETPAAEVKDGGKIEKAKADESKTEEPVLGSLISTAGAEFEADGTISEATSAELVKNGVPVEIQQVYLEGIKALREKAVGEIHSYVGGTEVYNQVANWAAQNLSDEELDAYNSAIDNPALRENAVRGLHARYAAARPSEGKLVSTSGAPAAAGDTYTSKDQLVRDQMDPRYKSDPRFRQEVEDRLARSIQNGFAVNERRMFTPLAYGRR